jgi:hypothetical protein
LSIALVWSQWLTLAISFGVLAALICLAKYVLRKIRAETVQHELSTEELLSKFRESHERGDLSDSEFRTIKTTLAEKLQNELRDDGQMG